MMNWRYIPKSSFAIEPWKNGLGSTDIIAEARLEGGSARGWDGLAWRLAQTEIASALAFSDHSGHDRHQVVVEGDGLFLDTPSATIDLSRPLKPVQYPGELRIVSRLENGPVKVLNLMVNRVHAEANMTAMVAGCCASLLPGSQIFYAVRENASLNVGSAAHHILAGDAIAFEATEPLAVSVESGIVVAASIYAK